MFVFILLLFSFIVFAFLVSNGGAGQVVLGRGYKEYRLSNTSNWLQKRVSSIWNEIQRCHQDSTKLSPIESGCCKPPTSCGFVYVNATFWTSTTGGGNLTDMDCGRWSNEQDELCYDCNSCKAAVLANLKHDWRIFAVLDMAVLIALVVVYSVGCCALCLGNNTQGSG
ncbi:hypothetical protein SUGI_0241620 [Cryptomeria japonica]|nr:hypothetical protein SUGI_0241620 [Cryptomeria japonica]